MRSIFFGFLSKNSFLDTGGAKLFYQLRGFERKIYFCIITGLEDFLLETVLRKRKTFWTNTGTVYNTSLNSHCNAVSGCPLGPVALMGWLPLWAGCPYGLVALVGGYVLRVGGPG